MVDEFFPETVFSAHRLRRWGLYWIILGFDELLEAIFHQEAAFLFFILIITLFVMPGTSRQLPLKRWALEFAVNLGMLAPFGLLFWWLSGLYHFEQRLAVAAACLLTGILLQIWVEVRWLAGPLGWASTNPLIERIRRL